jgi:hypothetical protein
MKRVLSVRAAYVRLNDTRLQSNPNPLHLADADIIVAPVLIAQLQHRLAGRNRDARRWTRPGLRPHHPYAQQRYLDGQQRRRPRAQP